MSTLILVVFSISVFHFIYESIIAPSIRMVLRDKLFALRDRLRELKIERDIESEAFEGLHDGINFLLPRLNCITISLTRDIADALKDDPDLRDRANNRREIIESSKNPCVVEIQKETFTICSMALACNSGPWFIYIFPIYIFPIALLTRLTGALKTALMLPAYCAEKLSPIEDALPAEA